MVGSNVGLTALVWLENKAVNSFKALISVLINELKLTSRDRSVWLWMVVVICLSTISVGFGVVEIKRQNSAIESLIETSQQERLAESAKLKDWGSAAYYNFHLTYNPPSTLAFAAMGQRDNQPWKHRIRMLALEGQIYERDVGNPSTALIGRFDFSFLASFIFPLVLIMLLYDLRASELTAGRYNLLESTAAQPGFMWFSRASLRLGGVFLCLIIPMFIAGLLAGSSVKALALVGLIILVYAAFWAFLCYTLAAWHKPGSVILMSLIGIWIITAVVLPTGGRHVVDRLVSLPSGAEILMQQRETVNDAWDLPREVTMQAFFERHPEWSDYEPEEGSFEWPWYYAFQQVGDQKTERLADAYRDGKLQRDHIAAWISLIAPPSLLERTLQSLAGTSLRASITYEQKVRAYHAELRAFYYPKFFRNEPFDKKALKNLPEFGLVQ